MADEGLRHGYGIETMSLGTKFRGYWWKDKRHGEGIFTNKRNAEFWQKWEYGLLKQERRLN